MLDIFKCLYDLLCFFILGKDVGQMMDFEIVDDGLVKSEGVGSLEFGDVEFDGEVVGL